MREAGVAALNNELTNSITKAQKQIYELEDKLETVQQLTQTKLATQEIELERYREQRRVEALLEKSKKLQAGEKVTFVEGENQKANIEQWNGFYDKWSGIINGLTSHSTPIEPGKAKVADRDSSGTNAAAKATLFQRLVILEIL